MAEVEEGSYNAQDVLEAYGSRSYRWDAAGDLEEVEDLGTGARLGLKYDALGNLRAATLPDGREVEYLVDARNRRVGVVVDGVSERAWVYSGQLNPVLELRPDGGRSRFVYGTRSHVPEYMERDGERYRLVTDHLGSVRLVVNVTTGLVAQRVEYGPWGEVEADTNPGFQPFGYAGGLYDRHTGLVRFGARDYDPSTGRWTRKDPAGFEGGISLYLYAFADPINLIDPEGRLPEHYWPARRAMRRFIAENWKRSGRDATEYYAFIICKGMRCHTSPAQAGQIKGLHGQSAIGPELWEEAERARKSLQDGEIIVGTCHTHGANPRYPAQGADHFTDEDRATFARLASKYGWNLHFGVGPYGRSDGTASWFFWSPELERSLWGDAKSISEPWRPWRR